MKNTNGKVIYGVTVNIDPTIAEDWQQWMMTVHIPDVMATGCFLSFTMCRGVSAEDQAAVHEVYEIMYTAGSMAELDRYFSRFAPGLQAEHTRRYEGFFAASRRVLQLLREEHRDG